MLRWEFWLGAPCCAEHRQPIGVAPSVLLVGEAGPRPGTAKGLARTRFQGTETAVKPS